jgi:HD-GYP domain-containing protein (c-di-GMP phosphodiesterase class II)
MDEQLATAQTLKYAQELRHLYGKERDQRRRTEDALARLEESYATTVRALAAALELRDDQTGGHAERVTALALRLTREVAPDLASNPELEYGFLLHDLGKIGIPDAILLKPGALTEREMDEMRYHPILGERIVSRVPYLGGVVRQVVAAHHERWDGNGYPRGLAGERIPLPARIFSVADAFDAMTSDRPYRQALSFFVALGEISSGAGKQFDPEIAEAFISLAPDLPSAAA